MSLRRLKVAHIITRLELGGAQQNTLYCCSHHDPKRFEVILLCGPGGRLDGEASRPSNPYKTFFLPELKHPIRPWWDLLALFKMTRILKKERVALVHTHSSKAGILGRWAAKRAGVPRVIHTVHGWGFYPGQFFPTRWLYQALERWAAGFTDLIITVSEGNRREGLAVGIGRKEQYRVIHSGIDPASYVLPAAKAHGIRKRMGLEGRSVVLVLSNFKKQKSPGDVVRVAALTSRKIPLVCFLWAGDGSARASIEAAIRDQGLEKNFKLLGWREDVAELLAASDVLLLTSLHEGLPRVVLQAMAAGKPVVATSVNGIPEAVKPGVSGFLLPPGDTGAMAESLFQILVDGALAARMGKAGRGALKGTFLIREMLRQIEKLYNERSNG